MQLETDSVSIPGSKHNDISGVNGAGDVVDHRYDALDLHRRNARNADGVRAGQGWRLGYLDRRLLALDQLD